MFGIITNLEIEENEKYVELIISYLTSKNISYYIAKVHQDKFKNYIYELPENIDYIIVLGGDGTILQAAQNSIELNAPIIGFNTGTLGFLAEYNIENYKEIIDKVINKEYTIDERSMLNVFSNNKLIDKCLNDAIISRDGFSRIVSIEVVVDNKTINKYNGDGIVICTPTGSTGYNLSLNGPIVSSKSKTITVTPIAAHSLLSRSIVLDTSEEIEIKILESRKTQEKEAILTCDGRRNIDLHSNDTITIKAAKETVKLLKMKNSNIFTICSEKLK